MSVESHMAYNLYFYDNRSHTWIQIFTVVCDWSYAELLLLSIWCFWKHCTYYLGSMYPMKGWSWPY